MPNNLRLKILETWEISGKSQNATEWPPSGQPHRKDQNFSKIFLKLEKNCWNIEIKLHPQLEPTSNIPQMIEGQPRPDPSLTLDTNIHPPSKQNYTRRFYHRNQLNVFTKKMFSGCQRNNFRNAYVIRSPRKETNRDHQKITLARI